jgi:hypothetical protein
MLVLTLLFLGLSDCIYTSVVILDNYGVLWLALYYMAGKAASPSTKIKNQNQKAKIWGKGQKREYEDRLI